MTVLVLTSANALTLTTGTDCFVVLAGTGGLTLKLTGATDWIYVGTSSATLADVVLADRPAEPQPFWTAHTAGPGTV
jgi:hypothetical protein